MDHNATRRGIGNLHDAFMNASLQRSGMNGSPPDTDPDGSFIPNRDRFQRTWVAFLYVLVEAWQATSMASVRESIGAMVDTSRLGAMIHEAKEDGRLDKMLETRNYMCHRDRREYWDLGRTSVVGQLEFHDALHDEFSEIFKAVARAIRDSDDSEP